MLAKILPYLYLLAKWTLTLILKTCRIRYTGLEKIQEQQKTSGLSMYAWHEKLMIIPFLKRFANSLPSKTIMPVLSGSKDGNLFDQVVLQKIDTVDRCIRVHSNARHQALRDISKSLKTSKLLIITPDGPSGPAYKIKEGALFASRLTKTPIYLFSWKASRCLKIPSWDRMQIPLPFSKISVIFTGPYWVDDSSELESQACELSKELVSIEPKKA